jgi:hypothetical protein
MPSVALGKEYFGQGAERGSSPCRRGAASADLMGSDEGYGSESRMRPQGDVSFNRGCVPVRAEGAERGAYACAHCRRALPQRRG